VDTFKRREYASREVHVSRKQYTPEFRAEAVRKVRDGKRGAAAVARELGISEQTLGRWLKQADVDEGRGPEGALTSAERDELQRLRRENKRLQEERDILKKATAFFAKENP
jgi:transposase